MNRIPKLLSKTKLLCGYRCPKCLYLKIHKPELEKPITPDLQALFDQGNAVGVAARNVMPGGVLVNNLPWDFTGALMKTRELIAAETSIIYEAAFEYRGCYARADIIQYCAESKRWRIYEVKSSTKIKPEHLDDVGLQVWIMAKSGLLIDGINIMHLNPACRFPDLSNLFKTQDVTAEMRSNYLTIQPKLADLFRVVTLPTVPDIDLGPHCLSPTECGFIEHCWKERNIPSTSLFDLPGMRDRKWGYYQDGILSLDDPRLLELNEIQERIVTAYKTGERYINREGIRFSLATWRFPLIFLDFETINPAIPRYEGCGPFHQVPFQFSVHVWPHPDAGITHIAYLHDAPDDPRPTLIPALLAACGTEGSIVAYYSRFESDRIQELAHYAPEYSGCLLSLTERMVDPLTIIRAHVYDNAFNGSFSLKKVAPALLGEVHSYKDMLVGDGGAAQRAFEQLISTTTPSARKSALRSALLDYCKKDTWVMVELVQWLFAQSGFTPDDPLH